MEPQSKELPLLGRNGPQWVPVSDVLFFSSNSKMVVHTNQGLFAVPTSLNDYLVILQSMNFDKLDKSNLVNLSNIADYDWRVYHAIFGNGESCHVSRRNRIKMQNLF